MRYKTKFNLLRDEVVKANNELVDNKVFETYVDEEQDTIMITNCIVKALVKTIKFYEQSERKLADANLKQFLIIQERNNEIDALKHMLDRKDID